MAARYKYTPEEIGQLNAENDRLRAALNRLRAAYNDGEISGSLWDKEQHCYVSLPVFFERTGLEQAASRSEK